MDTKNQVISATNLDVNATNGVTNEVLSALSELDRSLLNPSSIHKGGQAARYLIEEARESVAKLIGADGHSKVIFTSGATEANNTALLSVLFGKGKDAHVITSEVEHPSVLEPALKLKNLGFDVTILKPNKDGVVDKDDVIAALKPNTRMISLMHANNETGAISPISEIGTALYKAAYQGFFHVDGVQAVGKIPVDFSALRADLYSISGHKFGSLSGIGALIVKNGIEIEPIFYGGPQEKRSRAGTENLWGIYSMAVAAKSLSKNLNERFQKLENNREVIWSILRDEIEEIRPTVSLKETIPNTLSLYIKGVSASDLVVALDVDGVFVSSGAACASGKPGASHVLLALGLSEDEASQCIRISLGADYEKEELVGAAKKIVKAVRRIRDAG